MKKTILWIAISAALFAIFYELIPLDIYSEYLYFWVILGSVLVTASFLAFLVYLMDWVYHLDKNTKADEYIGYLYFAVIMLGIFGLGYLFLRREFEAEIYELKTYGVYTLAEITDSRSLMVKRTDLSKLEIKFTTNNGWVIITDVSISQRNYDNYRVHQKVPVKYSSKHPRVVRLVTQKEYQEGSRR